MRNKLFTLLLLSGFLLLAGLAGAEDMAFAAGQAGRPIEELLLLALAGIGAICAGCIGLNKAGQKNDVLTEEQKKALAERLSKDGNR